MSLASLFPSIDNVPLNISTLVASISPFIVNVPLFVNVFAFTVPLTTVFSSLIIKLPLQSKLIGPIKSVSTITLEFSFIV